MRKISLWIIIAVILVILVGVFVHDRHVFHDHRLDSVGRLVTGSRAVANPDVAKCFGEDEDTVFTEKLAMRILNDPDCLWRIYLEGAIALRAFLYATQLDSEAKQFVSQIMLPLVRGERAIWRPADCTTVVSEETPSDEMERMVILKGVGGIVYEVAYCHLHELTPASRMAWVMVLEDLESVL